MLTLLLSILSLGYAGPFAVNTPVMIDSVDTSLKPYDTSLLLATPLSLQQPFSPFAEVVAPSAANIPALHLLQSTFSIDRYDSATLQVDGLPAYKAFVDGAPVEGDKVALRPGTHSLTIKYLTTEPLTDSLSVKLEFANDATSLSPAPTALRHITLRDILEGDHLVGASISPCGRWIIARYNRVVEGGGENSYWQLREADGRVVATLQQPINWMPRSSRYYYMRQSVSGGGRDLITVDPATGQEAIFASNLLDGGIAIAPTEDFLILTIPNDAPAEDKEIYEVTEPEDRQPFFRKRSRLARYDVASGLTSPLTFGYARHNLQDISDDGRKALVMTQRSRLERRPTTLNTLLSIDLTTLAVDTIVADDGFIMNGVFSPSGDQVLVVATPEAFDRVGCVLPDSVIPSGVDCQLYLVDVASKEVRPLTRHFDPSVERVEWSRQDGNIYFTADRRDYVSLYRMKPSSGAIEQINVPEEMVNGFSLSQKQPLMVWVGESVSQPEALYTLDTRRLASTLLERPEADRFAAIELGPCEDYNFVNSRGDTIYGRFYLPPDFDPAKKYPLIVNYYGGCTPSARQFGSRYPRHLYAAMGYVVYVVNPSGAVGFGQEFSSRHVNTAGEGVAQDIIEGTKQFCQDHPYIDASRIGCIGASYGGFMTQYLQTVTDIFAAAISHAGISDHTSYWGEGWWGYSYSEIAMADSYPWSHRDLFVGQSPLYRADKIHTPLLFLHGDADTNVPVGESIQMFTALKLLGCPTAFVAVTDQDHHIKNYSQRQKWQDTIFAWFARYLKGEPEWWEALYPEKGL
ncbi:MAG: prolyl oligopeptidase family serine peptidase [Bacteroidales bacterium]|nr:prolyl oligopeptidase family serine peptidase [Bacteroidales bacterium]